MVAVGVFVLVEYYFWLVFPTTQHHVPPLGLRIYLNVSWGLLAVALFPDGGVREQGCTATGDEFPLLDADLFCDARRNRRGSVLSARALRWFRGAQRAAPTCKTTFISARNATTSSPPVAATASGRFVRQINTARDAATSWRRPDAGAAEGNGRIKADSHASKSQFERCSEARPSGQPGRIDPFRFPTYNQASGLHDDLRAHRRRLNNWPATS